MPYKTVIRLLIVARNPANDFSARLLGAAPPYGGTGQALLGMDCRAASHFVGSRPRLRGGRLFAGMTEVGDWMPPGSSPPGPVELPGGWTRLALAARPVRGLRRMSIALRILPSPYPLQHWPVLGGSASPFEADDGLLPAGRYDTDPITRRERGHIERSLRATTLVRDGGSGGNGIGNANWLSRYVRCRRHHLFGCQGAFRRARAMAGGIRSSPRVYVGGRTLATASQSALIRSVRSSVYLPRPARGLGV